LFSALRGMCETARDSIIAGAFVYELADYSNWRAGISIALHHPWRQSENDTARR
jgi:hypothetical protein